IAADRNWTTLVTGTTPEYFEVRRWSLASGRGLVATDVESASKVVVLGHTVAEKLYGAQADPLADTVRINGTPFEVIGVLAPKGQAPMGQDLDDAVFIPLTAYQRHLQGAPNRFITGLIFVSATSPEDTVVAEREITELLRSRHNIRPGAEDDFFIR